MPLISGRNKKYAKWILFSGNLIVLVFGLALLSYGIVNFLHYNNEVIVPMMNILFPTYALVLVGLITLIISFCGCCGTIFNNRRMMSIFATLVLIIFIIQTVIAIIVFKLGNEEKAIIRETMGAEFLKYGKINRESIDMLQRNFRCCGVDKYNDWRGKIPWSCCSRADTSDKSSCKPEDSYVDGCLEKVIQYFQHYGILISFVVIVILFVELMSAIIAKCLAMSISAKVSTEATLDKPSSQGKKYDPSLF